LRLSGLEQVGNVTNFPLPFCNIRRLGWAHFRLAAAEGGAVAFLMCYLDSKVGGTRWTGRAQPDLTRFMMIQN
jgi:hypothetical protein